MKTIGTREFTRHFTALRHVPCLVKDRGKPVGTWTPAPKRPPPVNFEARVKEDFTSKLPFTFVELLKEGKKR